MLRSAVEERPGSAGAAADQAKASAQKDREDPGACCGSPGQPWSGSVSGGLPEGSGGNRRQGVAGAVSAGENNLGEDKERKLFRNSRFSKVLTFMRLARVSFQPSSTKPDTIAISVSPYFRRTTRRVSWVNRWKLQHLRIS